MTATENVRQFNATLDALHVMADTPFTVEPGQEFDWPHLIAGCLPVEAPEVPAEVTKPKRGRKTDPVDDPTDAAPTSTED